MAGVKLPYRVRNNMVRFVLRDMGAKKALQGVTILKEDVYQSLGDYCGVGIENIKCISRNKSQPSLGVALKIAEYFDVDVEDIFMVEED